ncbi:PIG-L family deacetylase [Siphonobacter aquaeclarae]|uniref:N-acetylglucosaminyl deacetylase, LmbE family n=1 Tax=Siphonobacter aquaeclarae TaxID=563176 RepID=A0A1G9KMS1_9BACT|nr:PIG-L family deacetylase [Siphonobacter aquaeclarae]SDL50715.1 N-acetylglucosaminyl deacetylase, LmbE family [Siphonobacter aquaeclarae]
MKRLLLLFLLPCWAWAQGPKVLIVTAHPDDETMFPVTVFKITHEMKGSADLALLTDASGGYNGMVASSYFGQNLLDSATGRKKLPLLRKKEMMASGEILGISNFFFFDQLDDFYNRDEKPYLSGKRWDTAVIDRRLDEILARGQYDYIFCMVPHEGQHAHHKAASLSALRAAQRYKGARKPIVLGGQAENRGYTFRFSGLEGYPETRVTGPVFEYDRSHTFGEGNKHSYMIVADWVKASHKTQSGDMNQAMHKGDLEVFWYFAMNGENRLAEVKTLFETLPKSGFH